MAIDRKIVEWELKNILKAIGIDNPVNHEEIVDFMKEDIEASADHILWHSGDASIAFRRFLEKDVTF